MKQENVMAVMNTYICMLRGINVSGQKLIKMADLKALYDSLHLKNVATYIQSGNVVFQSPISDPMKITASIERAIEKSYGFSVAVVLRSPSDFRKVIDKRPPLGAGKIDETRLYVTFLKSKPDPSLARMLAAAKQKGTDVFAIAGSEIYVYCPNGYGKTVLSNTFFEKQLKITSTTRNWNTVQTLLSMARDLEK
jgi:uncharacterized protein (DUF1697 family)